MYCEECQQRSASVHFMQISEGKKIESHLCEECATKKGALKFDINKFSIPDILGSFFGSVYDMQARSLPPRVCSNCGINFAYIAQTGKLGCSECYSYFEPELDNTLRRISGNNHHIGKIPVRNGQQVRLKKQIEEQKTILQQAIADEKYEEAASIRDSIKELEKGLS